MNKRERREGGPLFPRVPMKKRSNCPTPSENLKIMKLAPGVRDMRGTLAS